MKHYLIVLLILMGVSSCCNKNQLTLDCGALNPHDIVIYLSTGIPIHLNDNPTLIYKEGVHYTIPNEYGENDWIIIYKGQLQCMFRHFKTNSRYIHKYKFIIYEKQDTFYCDINIRGKNSMLHSIQFTPIVDSKDFFHQDNT